MRTDGVSPYNEFGGVAYTFAHELDALRFLEAGFSERQLYYLLVENSRLFTRHGRKWGRYSYAVPGQRQGEFTQLRVIGDNQGGRTTTRIGRDW